MVGMYVLFWLDIGYLDYRCNFSHNRILFTDNIFQAKTWTSFKAAYCYALKLCKCDNSYNSCLIVRYDFVERKNLGITLMSHAFKKWGDI